MTPERWSLIGRVFDRAVELPPPERGAYLDGACAGDPALRREVDSLLHAYACSEGPDLPVLPRPAVREPGETGDCGRRLVPGERVGAYRVVQELGAGGMGVVYLGRRDDDRYRREVAIKVLHRDLGGRSARLRFRTECQILAALEHPNIARLRLFQKVCHGVHSAHQHLVVHRDIKPGNILVTADGEPKLLDFGIAKLVAPSPERDLTRTGMRPMTPEYASPEQILGEPVTTASDVYSLGMLLYRLLVGRLPPPDDRLSAAELGRLVAGGAAGDEPVGSGRRGTEVSGGGPRPSACAGTAALRRQLRGDLDGIVLMALQRRLGPDHPDVAASLHDLAVLLRGTGEWQRSEALLREALESRRRHLGSEHPEVAETLYRLAEVRLDRMGFADAEGFATEALEVRRRVYGDEHREVVASLGQVAESLRAQGRFDEAAPVLEESLAVKRRLLSPRHPEVAVSLGHLARVLEAQGDLEEAEVHHRAAIEIERHLGHEKHPDFATMVNNLGVLERRTGDFAAAEALLRQAYELRVEVLDEGHPYLCQSRFSLADILHEQGKLDEAEGLYRGAIRVCARILPARHHDQAWAKLGLGRLLSDRGRPEASEPLLREALSLLVGSLPAEHWRIAEAESAVARNLALQARPGEAAALLVPAHRRLEARLGAGHRATRRAEAWLRELQGRG